ncbi:uncharacterized protein LOC144480424 isoform X2 [Mustelus asterias]
MGRTCKLRTDSDPRPELNQANPKRLNSSCAGHYDKGKDCCNECQAGFYLSAPCTAERLADCKPCGEGEYLEHSNSQTECLKQIECDEMKGFEVLHKGDAVTATQCVCRANYHCSQDCEYCLRDNPCLPGFEVKEKANRISDTKCRPCPSMYFSNETSLTAKCKPRTNCTALGMKERVPGSPTSDTVCISVDGPTPSVSDGPILAIAVGLACGCGIMILFIWVIVSHRKTLATLTDCVRQRIADAWCSIKGEKRSQGNSPADQVIGSLPSDNQDWDPERELFIPPKYPEKAADRIGDSNFYSLAERPDCCSVLNPSCGDEPLGQVAPSPRTLKELPDSKYSDRNGGQVSSAIHLKDLRTANSTNPPWPAGCKMEESIHSNPSRHGSRNNDQTQTSCDTLTSGSTTPLSYRQSNEGHSAKCDGHTSHQSNYSHRPDHIDGHSSNKTDFDHSDPGDDDSHNSGNSIPSGFSCNNNATYNASGQSVLSVGGSVTFKVIVKVNHATEQDSSGEASDRADLPGTPRENEGFPTREGRAGRGCDSETGVGFPVQEQHCQESVHIPIQEEQSSGHKVNISIQEQNGNESLAGMLSLASETSRGYSQGLPEESTSIPMQEDGKSEHLPNKEESY